MDLILFIALLAAVVIIVVLIRKVSSSTEAPNGTKKPKLPGVRREAAQERQLPKSNQHLFTREVMAGNRRFFFDVDEGERGKYLRISEVEQARGKQERAFTLIVFEREIKGFYKALKDAADKMGGV